MAEEKRNATLDGWAAADGVLPGIDGLVGRAFCADAKLPMIGKDIVCASTSCWLVTDAGAVKRNERIKKAL
jgi:hypothetical protein